MAGKFRHIIMELKGHSPFTVFGALLGVIFMILFRNSGIGSHTLFSIFHPVHVVLSAIVTASMFRIHTIKKKFITVLIIGYLGSVGIATLSDILMPHLGSSIFGLDIPTHSEVEETSAGHSSVRAEPHENQHDEGIHFGFIKEWYLVNPAAILGVLIGFFLPHTKFPHAGHILISTWASSSYLLMRVYVQVHLPQMFEIFGILFLSVWIPCVISDIIFPLLFVRPDIVLTVPCPDHKLHSHPHKKLQQEQLS